MIESPPEDRRVVIVLGPGRSGTSTIAGTLAMTGMEVPGEAIKGNQTNPAGFYEPRWVVDFHKQLLSKAGVRDLDTSPQAMHRIAKLTAGPKVRQRLHDWLGERLESQPRLVIKDPRAIWFQELWASTCEEFQIEPGYVTMLRHPAEVAGSREKYYQKAQPDEGRGKQILRIAGWINVALTAEKVTEGHPRNFVRYTDLVADWRKVLTRVAETQRLQLDPPADTSPHPVDEFIDPTLHRVTTDWDSVDVPNALRDLGERTWGALTAVADDGDATEAALGLTEVRRDYAEYVEVATVLTSYEARRRERRAVRRGRRKAEQQPAGRQTRGAREARAKGRRTKTSGAGDSPEAG